MIDPLKDLLPASFRGVEFFVRTEEREGGRKLKVFEYPLTKRRDIQDLGGRYPVYSVQALVCGEKWLQDATKLRNVCESKTAGTLVLPSYGVFRAVCVEIKEQVADTKHGIVSFSMTFAVQQQSKGNIGTLDTTIDAAAAKVMSELKVTFGKKLDVEYEGVNKDVIENDFSTLKQRIDKDIPAMVTETQSFMDKLNTIISDVDALTNALLRDGMLGIIMNSLPADGSMFGTMKKLWTFGNQLSRTLPSLLGDISTLQNLGLANLVFGPYGIPTWLGNTSSRRQRNQNRIAVVLATRSVGLVGSMVQAVGASYTTVSQLDYRIGEIEDAFQNIVYDDNLNYSSALVSAMESMKSVCYKELDKKRERAYKIKDAQVERTTSALLAYQLYNEKIEETGRITDFYVLSNFIGRINPTQRRDKIDGLVRVLEVE